MRSTTTATFVFTDLVDSTAIASQLGPDDADSLRAAHFAMLRDAVGATGGTEVKGLGDGLMVVYTSVTRALAGAVAMQQALHHRNRRSTTPLTMRIGVSTGDVTEEDGDYFGSPVVEAARLCAAAGAGQILTTDLVARLVGRHAEYELEAVGDLELKGLPEPVAALEVHWDPATGGTGSIPLPPALVGLGGRSVFAFFGRETELTSLDDSAKAVATGSGLRLTLIGGEPGMGKTTLAAQAARVGHRAGAVVLFGACAEDLCPPYGPWIAALTHLTDHAPPELLEGLRPIHRRALAQLHFALGGGLPPRGSDGAAGPGDHDAERFLLMDAVIALLAAVTVEVPGVVVLDDLQWADAASIDLLRHLLGSTASIPLFVIGTYRTSDLHRTTPLSALLAESHRDSRVERIDLRGLSDGDVVDLIEAAAGHELNEQGIALAHAVHRETDGNAFFVTEVLRHLAESGEFTTDAEGRYELTRGLDGLALPRSVREVVEQRVTRLGDDTARALEAAAVIGLEFDVAALYSVAELDEDALLDALDRAAVAALVTEAATPNRFRFTHALIQHTLAASLSRTRRQRIHRTVAEALEASGAPTAEVARHWIAATRPTDSTKARAFAAKAGDEALAAFAPVDAVRWYTQALELFDQAPDAAPHDRCRLLIALARAQAADGFLSEMKETIEIAGTLALELGHADLIVESALVIALGDDPYSLGRESDRILIRAALETPGDAATRARLLTALATTTDPQDWRRRHALAAEATAAALASGDHAVQLDVLTTVDTMIATPERLDERLAVLGAAFHHPAADRSPWRRPPLTLSFAQALLERGDLEGFARCGEQCRRESEQSGLRLFLGSAAGFRALLAVIRGDLEAAETAAVEQFETWTAIRHPMAQPVFGIMLLHLRRMQGRLDEVIGAFADAAAIAGGMPAFSVRLAQLYAELGQLDEARAAFAKVRTPLLTDMVPRDIIWLPAMVHGADIIVALEDHAAAEEMRGILSPFEAHFATTGVSFDGLVAAALANLDAMLGDRVAAERRHVAATAEYRRLEAPYWLATTLLDHAGFLDADPGTEARATAARNRIEAREIAARHGFAGLTRRADRVP